MTSKMAAFQVLAAGVLLSLFSLQSVAVGAASGRRLLTSEDFYRVQEVSDPQISPDGLWVAYVVTSNNREADEAQSAIWMVSWDGSERLSLTSPADGTSKPHWSPDGRYLAFLGNAPGSDKSQLMLLDRRGGAPRRLTSVAGEIEDYVWSPDGGRIVMAMDADDGEKSIKPIVIDGRHFKDDAGGYLSAGRRRHLYALDILSMRVEGLTGGLDFNEDLPAWSPDGTHIAFVRTRDKGADVDGKADLVVMEAQAGAAARILARPYAPNAQHLAWSPDGRSIAYLQGTEPKFNAYMQDRLFVIEATGGAPRAVTDKLDRAVTSYAFCAEAKSIQIVVEDDGTAYPERVDLVSGAILREGPGGPSSVNSLTCAATHTVMLLSNDQAPAEVYALEGQQARKLTGHNDALLAELSLGAVEDIRFKSKDGAEIHGMIVKPPSFVSGRRYPTMLWIHGGPNGGDEHSLTLDGYQFEPQMFAAKGFVVLRVNYRGGSGRGSAYAKAIFADWGHKEVDDLLAGVDFLVGQGIADKERLGIGGWSYGGILTDYTIATDRRFKVAISGAGSGNQLSTYGTDQYALQYNNELGPPWRNSALWLKVSYPFFHADRIRTPTLFLGGEKDFNVPISGGEQMYQALQTLGVPSQLVVYPGEHHVFTRPSFVKDLADRMSAWIDRFIVSSH